MSILGCLKSRILIKPSNSEVQFDSIPVCYLYGKMNTLQELKVFSVVLKIEKKNK